MNNLPDGLGNQCLSTCLILDRLKLVLVKHTEHRSAIRHLLIQLPGNVIDVQI